MRVRWSLLVVSLVSLLFAGCVSEPEPAKSEEEDQDGFVYEDDRIKFRSNNKTARDWVPTLDESPQWALGQWWKVRVTENFTGSTVEAYRVVAGEEDDFFLVGMPTHDFSNDLMVLHIPGFGQIGKSDLSFEAHDVWFRPMQFPVKMDDTWKTGFETEGNLDCTVEEVGNLTAQVVCRGSRHVTIDYDAEIRGIRKMAIRDYATYEVIESGFDFHEQFPEWEGVVTVPHMSDLIFFHGRIGGAVQLSPEGGPVAGLNVSPVPYDTVNIPSSYDRVSFVIILGDILGQGLPAGFYRETATAPDGQVYEVTLTAADGAPLTLTSFKHDAPGGDWELEHIALGPGTAFLEGIGYHVYDIELPSGHLRPSIGEHQHGSEERH